VTVSPESVDIPIDCIRKLADNNFEIIYDPLYGDTTAIIDEGVANRINSYKGKVDAAVLFIGDNRGAESETESIDRQSMEFPNYMNSAVSAACDMTENVIVVMQTGAPCIPFRWHNRVKSIIQMWYAGEAGGMAVAKILFGAAAPGGRLSETFPLRLRTDMEHQGDGLKVWYKEGFYIGYRYYDEHPEDVWYPFGHGLTYTDFRYESLQLRLCEDAEGKPQTEVKFEIINTGNNEGCEVAQIYVRKKDSQVIRPYKQLKAFSKITVKPGEMVSVSQILCWRDFSYYNTLLRDWYVESGDYEILIGASCMDIRLREVLIIK